MIDLHAELWRAMQLARDSRVEPGLAGLCFTHRLQWGFARVAFYGLERELYEPTDDGPSIAFIVPVVEDGDTIDLAAIDGNSEHVGTRLGLGRGLGLDTIEKARFGCCDLGLVRRPLDWLRDPLDTVYLFDLRDAVTAFDGVKEITCSTVDFADRVRHLFPPSQRSRILAPAP
jgi:hypothetical protein